MSSPLLADAIGLALLLFGCFSGLVGFTFALIVETLILRLVWKRRRILGWVLLANLASFAAGVVPTILFNVVQAPGPRVDPWHWHQTFWLKLAGLAAALFVASVIVEAAVYWLLNRRAEPRVGRRFLIWGTVVANVTSYLPLTGYLLYVARGTGDFTFLPDTRWVRADDTRVYFVDPQTNRIQSMRLDGSDRRLECPYEVGRFEGQIDPTPFYALLKDDPRVLFVGADRQWHVWDPRCGAGGDPSSSPAGAQTLQSALPADKHGWTHREDAAASLHAALAELGIQRNWPLTEEGMEGVYLSSASEFDFRPEPVEVGGARIWGGTSPYTGAGMGLGIPKSAGGRGGWFSIWAGGQSLACQNPTPLPDAHTIVFRCGGAIMVLDLESRRVGQLVTGDGLLLKLPQFSQGGWQTYALTPTTTPTTSQPAASNGLTTRPDR